MEALFLRMLARKVLKNINTLLAVAIFASGTMLIIAISFDVSSKMTWSPRFMEHDVLKHMEVETKLPKLQLKKPTEGEVNLLKRAAKEAHKYAWNISEESRDPQEVSHVVFIKVHKAASTTLYNLFLRFAYSRQLNVLFPTFGSNILSVYRNGLSRLMQHPPSPPFLFDVLVNHVVFNHSLISPFFPKDARYVAVVRNPWDLVLSSYSYFTAVEPKGYLTRSRNFEDYVRHQSKYEDVPAIQSLTNNRMSVDLGLSPDQVTNGSRIAPFLAYLDSKFDLVLVVERLEESLVLLKRALRWTLKDIVYMNLNIHRHSQSTNLTLDTELMRQFRHFEQFDHALYDHCVQTLDRKVAQQTPDFHEEVDTFTTINRQITSFCATESSHSTLDVPSGTWSVGFRITRPECDLLKEKDLLANSWVQLSQLSRLAPVMFNLNNSN